MDFHSYYYSIPKDDREAFAGKVGTSVGYLSLLASGHRQIGETLALKIEKESDGKCTVEEMRPDVPWDVIRNKRAKSKTDRRQSVKAA